MPFFFKNWSTSSKWSFCNLSTRFWDLIYICFFKTSKANDEIIILYKSGPPECIRIRGLGLIIFWRSINPIPKGEEGRLCQLYNLIPIKFFDIPMSLNKCVTSSHESFAVIIYSQSHLSAKLFLTDNANKVW